MTQLTKTEFDIQTAALFPTNGVGTITALKLRTQINNMADSVPFKTTGATAGPTVNDDGVNTSGNGAIQIGDIWVDETNNVSYICLDNSTAAAIWVSIASVGSDLRSYDLRFDFSTTPTTSQVITTIMIVRDIVYPANLVGSVGSVGVNPTASFTMTLKDDGVTIGNIIISTLGAFTFATSGGTAKTVLAGSALTLVAPAGVDATVNRMAMTLLAHES